MAWIITDDERARFVTLVSDRDRDRFIEEFWQRRNPEPARQENKFKEEHYRRIAWAGNRFGLQGHPGWQTERGRLYIQLGPPDVIEAHPSELFEIWTYGRVSGSPHSLAVTFRAPGGAAP